jgi:hypothetical protein
MLLTDEEIFKVAVNFSIIKHNEFKAYTPKLNMLAKNQTRGDTGMENLRINHIEDSLLTQDYQMLVTDYDRRKRTIYLEDEGKYIYNDEFTDDVLTRYA